MSWAAPGLDPKVRKQILVLRARGASFHRIAADLNRHGMYSVLGGRWYGASVRRIVTSSITLHKE